MNIKKVTLSAAVFCAAMSLWANNHFRFSASISLKKPGNRAVVYSLKESADRWVADTDIPVTIVRGQTQNNPITVTLTAKEDIYFNFKQKIDSEFRHDDCQFYMPGFWYRRNLRSPQQAPSFHTSDS